MNVGKNDMGIMFSMTVAVIAMSFLFPALGLGGDEVSENEIPEFNISSDRFDFAGEFPDDPGAPSMGELEREQDSPTARTSTWLHGDESDGVVMTLFYEEPSNTSNNAVEINVVEWDAETDTIDSVSLNEVGNTVTFTNFSYEILFSYSSLENGGSEDRIATVEWEVLEQESGTGWIDRIPVVGGIFGTGEAVASVVGWIGSILWWGIKAVITLLLNFIGILFDVAVFFISLLSWIGTTYGGIISNAPGWAAVVAAFPALILSLMWGKMIVVLIDILWIG